MSNLLRLWSFWPGWRWCSVVGSFPRRAWICAACTLISAPCGYSGTAGRFLLTKKEFDLLLLFARNPNTALYRESIYERVWGGEFPYGSRAVDLLVQRLRKKVGWNRELKAVNKVGYRLEVPQ